MKKWVIKKTDEAAAASLSKETGLGTLITRVLTGRGICGREAADGFFKNLELSDPFLLTDMDIACKLIKTALINGDKITIYGDYDCDGVTSTVMLYNYLTALGGEADWYIPSRDEGYGLNIAAIDKIYNSGTKMIITVDNGISAAEEAERIRDLGLSLIITDHHQVPPVMPWADAIINPNREGDISPFKKLAGCGVVLKLIMALESDTEGNGDSVLEQFADLAAIGTVGDIVPLVSENRCIVERGLEVMLYTENVGLRQLLKQCGYIDDPSRLTATSLAFTVCPRINAAGRFSHAGKAAELLTCENNELAASKASELSQLNTRRQEAEAGICKEVDDYFAAAPDKLCERVLAAVGNGWHHGIIGIISSRLLTKWEKPNLIITIEGDTARGSARSYEGFSLYKLLYHCRDLLIKFGGHTKAAGFTLKTENIPAFLEEIKKYTDTFFPVMPIPETYIDAEIFPSDLSMQNVEQLSILAPFGEENPPPLFLMRDTVLLSKKPLKDGKYVSFNVDFGGREQRILHFGSAYGDFGYNTGDKLDLLVNLEINEYNDTKSISAQVRDIRTAGFSEDKYFAAKNTYESIKRGEAVDKKLLVRIIPENGQIKTVYDIIRSQSMENGAVSIPNVFGPAMQKQLNYCLTCVILDIFEEFNLIKKDIIHNTLTLQPAAKKVDLTKSLILQNLKIKI